MKSFPFELDLNPPHRAVPSFVPAVQPPDVGKPLFAGLLHLSRLVVNCAGERTAFGEIEARFFEAKGMLIDMQVDIPIRNVVGSSLARARDEVNAPVNCGNIRPDSDIGKKMDF